MQRRLINLTELDERQGSSCRDCKYAATCYTPCMKPYGSYKLGMLFVGEAPGAVEDRNGRPFLGESGTVLRDCVPVHGDLDVDALSTNTMRCRPPGNKFPPFSEIVPCTNHLKEFVREKRPKIIVCVGGKGYDVLLPEHKSVAGANISNVRGHIIPLQKYNTVMMPVLHPSWISQYGDAVHKIQLKRDLDVAWRYARNIGKFNHLIQGQESFEILWKIMEIEQWLHLFSETKDTVSFDYEMTGLDLNKDQILCVSLYSMQHKKGISFFFDKTIYRSTEQSLRLVVAFRKWLSSSCRKIVTDINTEVLWSYKKFSTIPENVVEDTTVSSWVVDQRRGTNSLAWRTFVYFGKIYKGMVNIKGISQESLVNLAKYNMTDAFMTSCVSQVNTFYAKTQKQSVGNQLVNEAAACYSKMSCRGIKIDTNELGEIEKRWQEKRSDFNNELQKMECVKEYKKSYGKTYESTQTDRTRNILFDILKAEYIKLTKKGFKPAADKDSFEHIYKTTEDKETKSFVKCLLDLRSIDGILQSAANIRKNMWNDGKLHPSFKMNTAITYRSSSAKPNLQNVHKHGDGRELRKSFIPTNSYFLEVDYGAMEVRIISFYSKDKVLIDQLRSGFDMHRYWASLLYKCAEKDVSFDQRYKTKNQFVFPTFYGSFYKNTAPNLGLSINHVQGIERGFWNLYWETEKANKELLNFYYREGYIEMLNGFRVPGPLDRNKIINYRVQGTASHYLAASCIDIERDFERRKLESFQCGQIHDSILVDVKREEVPEVMHIIKHNMMKKRWGIEECDFLTEFSIGKNWLDMIEIEEE